MGNLNYKLGQKSGLYTDVVAAQNRRRELLAKRINARKAALAAKEQARNATTLQASSALQLREEESENNGGIPGGIGYLAEKFGLGALSSIEGIWDYTAGGIAKLFGANEWAEEQFTSDWADYNHADDWYNPDEGWSFAGDIAGGIGSSLPAIGAVAFTGGTLSPLAAGIISGGVAGLGAAGNATKEAYRETGELGGKEFGYGALVGLTEGSMEGVSGLLGTGTGRIISALSKNTARKATKGLAKSGAKTVFKNLGKDFLSEAFEEGVAEIVSPLYQRATYDPDAEFASAEEIAYAALVGGLSGAIMSGSQMGVDKVQLWASGNKAESEGLTSQILSAAKKISEDETQYKTESAAYEAVKSTYERLSASLEKTGGKIVGASQKALLGQLKRENAIATMIPFVEKSALKVARDPQAAVERFNQSGIKDANGQPMLFTKEQILSGIDSALLESDSKSDRKKLIRQVRKSLLNNTALTLLAVSDVSEGLLAASQEVEMQEERIRSFEEISSDRAEPLPQVIHGDMADGTADGTEKFSFGKRQADGEIKKAAVAIDLSEDDRLSAVVAGTHGSERYKKIREYILDELADQPIRLSDGKLAIVDRSDAQHIAQKSGDKKTAEISHIKQIVETAQLVAEEESTKDRKFDYFWYYEALVKYDKETIPVYVNVGRAGNDSSYHIYDLTQKIRDTAHRVNDVERPKPNEGYALENGISTHSISHSDKKSNSFSEKNFETAKKSDVNAKNALYNKILKIDDMVPESADALIRAYSETSGISAEQYARAVELGYLYGAAGIRMNQIPQATEFWELSESQRRLAYELGSAVRAGKDAAREQEIERLKAKNYRSADENENVLSMIDKVNSGEAKGNEKVYLGTISVSAAAEIQSITGINVDGFKVAIEARQIEHILKRHGEKGTSDKSMTDPTDIAKIEYTLDNYDDIRPAGQTRAYKHFVNGKTEWADTVLYEKEIGDKSYYVVQAVPDTKAKTLYIVTAFIGKQGYMKEVSQFIDAQSPDATPKSEIASTSIHSIPENASNVNSNSENNSASVGGTKTEKTAKRQGTVTVKADESTLSERQKVSAMCLRSLSKAIGVNFVVEKLSTRTATGRIGENGRFDHKTNTVYIDLNAGNDGEGVILFTASHELTHFIAKWSPAKYKVLRETLFEFYGQTNKDVIAMAREQMAAAKEAGHPITFDAAIEEVVADAMERMLTDGNAQTILESLEKKDKSIVEKIKDYFRDLLAKIRKAYEGAAFQSDEAQFLHESAEAVERVQALFFDALSDAGETYREIGESAESAEGGVSFSTRKEYDPEKAGIHEQIRNAQDELNKMPIVFSSDVPLKVGKKYEAGIWAVEQLRKYGFQADRQGFGKIYFTDTNIRDAMNYLDTDAEKVSIVALYKVLKQGIIVGEHGNHKMRQKHTITFAAPVELNGVRGNMAVVVNMKNNQYKVHRILMPDGSMFTFSETKKDTERETQRGVPKRSLANATSSVSNSSIPHSGDSVNTNSENNSDSSYSVRKSNRERETKALLDTSENRRNSENNIDHVSAELTQLMKDMIEELQVAEERGNAMSEFSEELRSKLAEESEMEYEADLKRAKAKDAKKIGVTESPKQTMRRVERERAEYQVAKEKARSDKKVETAKKNAEKQVAYEKQRNEYRLAKEKESSDKKVEIAKKNAEKKIAFVAHRAEYEASKARKETERELKIATKEIMSEANLRATLLGNISRLTQKMRELKLGVYANATQDKSELFKGSVEGLAKIQWNGNLSVKLARKHIGALRDWYTTKNEILCYKDETNPGYYDKHVAEMLADIAEGDGVLSNADLRMIRDIVQYFIHFDKTYNKVFKNGRWIDAEPEAKRYISTIEANKKLKVGLFAKIGEKRYAEMFSDPLTVARCMDRYAEDGFYTEMLLRFREGAARAAVLEMELLKDYDAFMQKNKNYLAKASTETIEYRGAAVPRMHLIGHYMTLKREHAQAGFVINGFSFRDKNGDKAHVLGPHPEYVHQEGLTQKEIAAAADAEIAAIGELLTEADREYIAILEKGYNEEIRKLKVDCDIERLGYTNATDDYYYPVRRGYVAKSIDTSTIFDEMDRVSNASYNKNTVKGAKQELFVESADMVFRRHLRSVTLYASLAPAIDTYNRIYNMDISGNPNKPISVRTASENVWKDGEEYFKKLVSDIQGIPAAAPEGQKLLGFIRRGYAQYQLGANLKTCASQLSSLFASSSILDPSAIARGMTIDADGIDKYCLLAKLRNYDNTAVRSQGLLEQVNKVSGFLMMPIGKIDRFVVCRLFGACQAQIEQNGGAKVGTEENKVEAGKLLEKVLFETQQNALATEKSKAMRSGNELYRALTMFSADGMKVIGRVIDSIGEVSVLKVKQKQGKLGSNGEAQLKAAKRKAKKSVNALLFSSAFMVGVAEFFKFLYAKEDEDDENKALALLTDFGGNLLGGLPALRDAYSLFFDGYELDNYAYSTINDLLSSAKGLYDAFESIFSGEATSEEIASDVKRMVYAAGQLFGIPVRNLYNTVYGLIKRVSPATAYDIDSIFYERPSRNLYSAVLSGDKAYIEHIRESYTDEDSYTSALRKALRENDARVGDAAAAVLDGDFTSYEQILSEIAKEGNFTVEDIACAINTERNSKMRDIDPEAPTRTLASAEVGEGDDSVTVCSIYSASDINMLLESGDGERANAIISKLIAFKMENGKTEKEAKASLRSSLTSYWKKLYKEAWDSKDMAEVKRIRRLLYESKLYGRLSELDNTLKSWRKES